jgi:hypothetical protein
MIEKAIAAEQEYLQRRLNGEDVALDLSEYGYESLDAYFADKKEYRLKHCGIQMYELPINDALDQFVQAINNQTPGVWEPIIDKLFVWHGNEYIDTELCDELGVGIYQMPDFVGGNIVSGPEDLSLAFCIPADIDITTEYILNKLKEIMDKYIDGVTIDGNDFLLNGRKIMGVMNLRANGMYLFACHISYADHTEYINQICGKKSAKIPGHIDSSLLPKQTLKNEVLAWLS